MTESGTYNGTCKLVIVLNMRNKPLTHVQGSNESRADRFHDTIAPRAADDASESLHETILHRGTKQRFVVQHDVRHQSQQLLCNGSLVRYLKQIENFRQ